MRQTASRQRDSLPKQSRTKRTPARPGKFPYAWIGGALLVLILVAGGIWLASRQASRPATWQNFPIQSRDHIALGATHPAYNSDPPTSGWHYDTPEASGFHEQPVADEEMVHNLEHGYIVVSYDCSKLADCAATKTQIRRLLDRYNNWKVVAVPRKNADAAIALTAWGWLDKIDGYDEARITAFMNAWRDRGPEKTAD